MVNFSTQNRSSSSWSLPTKSSSSYDYRERAGLGWYYDEENMFYDQVISSETGSEVFYDGDGATITWGNQTRN